MECGNGEPLGPVTNNSTMFRRTMGVRSPGIKQYKIAVESLFLFDLLDTCRSSWI